MNALGTTPVARDGRAVCTSTCQSASCCAVVVVEEATLLEEGALDPFDEVLDGALLLVKAGQQTSTPTPISSIAWAKVGLYSTTAPSRHVFTIVFG
ncbi:MAG: hypothetical protein U0270_17090 [Labilithrix sp.]